MIHTGDAIEVMAGMAEASVDAVCTDPPYGLEFMGKKWDRFWTPAKVSKREGIVGSDGVRRTKTAPASQHTASPNYRAGAPFQAWCEAWGREALRVTVPGGYLLAFGGTRTHHRLVCGLEDAGWIIRDELTWIYASGFPKGKANLKPAHEPIVLARKPGPLRMLNIDATRIGVDGGHEGAGPGPSQGILGDGLNGARAEPVPGLGRWPSNILLTDDLFSGGVDGVVGGGEAGGGFGRAGGNVEHAAFGGGMQNRGNEFGYGDSGGYSRFFLIPKADRADREPVLRDAALLLHRERGDCDKLGAWESEARSPSERTGSTSPARDTSVDTTAGDDSDSATSSSGNPSTDPSQSDTRSTISTATSRTTDSKTSSSLTPLPTSDSTPGASSGMGNGGSPAESADSSSLWGPLTGTSAEKAGPSTDAVALATSGSSSKRNRCALCGKPLPRVGVHPTTKPTELMRHLIRLVTPSGGVILDPFAGSGTTGVAAELEGFDYILIEQSAEYVAIAEARLNGVQKGLGLDVPAPTRKRSPGNDDIGAVARRGRKPHGESRTTYLQSGFQRGTPPKEVA